MQKRTERNKANYPQPITIKQPTTYLVSVASREPTPKSRNDYNLHIRSHSAMKVREIATLCNTTNAEVLTAMIDFAYDRARFTKPQSDSLICTFADIGGAP